MKIRLYQHGVEIGSFNNSSDWDIAINNNERYLVIVGECIALLSSDTTIIIN